MSAALVTAVLTAVLTAAMGCAPEAASPTSSELRSQGSARLLWHGAPTPLHVVRVLHEAPEGGDGPTRLVLAGSALAGSGPGSEAIDADALGGLQLGEEALVLRPTGVLELVHPQGLTRLDAHAVVVPVASGSGDHIAWVRARGLTQALVVMSRDGSEAVVAQGLASIGAIVIEEATSPRVAFVGATEGGIAGVWVAREGMAPRCLTNCALRVGRALGPGHSPLPAEPLRFEGEALVAGAHRWSLTR